MDDAGLRELAASTRGGAAAVVRVDIDRRPDGKSKGTGHIIFANRRAAEAGVKVGALAPVTLISLLQASLLKSLPGGMKH